MLSYRCACDEASLFRRSRAASFFDPGLLLGDQALHKVGSFFLEGLNTLVEKHLANLRQSPLLIVRYAL